MSRFLDRLNIRSNINGPKNFDLAGERLRLVEFDIFYHRSPLRMEQAELNATVLTYAPATGMAVRTVLILIQAPPSCQSCFSAFACTSIRTVPYRASEDDSRRRLWNLGASCYPGLAKDSVIDSQSVPTHARLFLFSFSSSGGRVG